MHVRCRKLEKKKKKDGGWDGLLKKESSETSSHVLQECLGVVQQCLVPCLFSPLHILERTAPVEWVGNNISRRRAGSVQQTASS